MKKVIYLVALLIISACQKEESPNAIPAYLKIDAITLDENNTSANITDAWVYFDNNLQGIYPLPTIFPVLAEGKQNISIKAGIKNNGIAAIRVEYPFYDYFNSEIISKYLIEKTFDINLKQKYLWDK